MKTVITFGVFDMLHWGHFELFRRMRELVGETGNVYVLLKPGCKLVYDFTTRKKMIETLRTVDKVIPYDVVGVAAVIDIAFDILVVGPEHTNARFQALFKWCTEKSKDIVVIPRSDGISTTMLKSFRRNI